jgi:hypothetical protein
LQGIISNDLSSDAQKLWILKGANSDFIFPEVLKIKRGGGGTNRKRNRIFETSAISKKTDNIIEYYLKNKKMNKITVQNKPLLKN